MSVGTSGFSDSAFTAVYLPTIAAGFLWSVPEIQIRTWTGVFRGHALEIELLGAITLVSLIGSLQYHEFFKAIFGYGGPSKNPKLQSTSLRGILAILFKINPREIPIHNTPREYAREIWGIKVGFNRFLRLLKFSPIAVTWALSWALIPVYGYLILSGMTNFIAILIFLTIFTLQFRGRFSSSIPNPNVDYEDVDQVEFEKSENERGRIK